LNERNSKHAKHFTQLFLREYSALHSEFFDSRFPECMHILIACSRLFPTHEFQATFTCRGLFGSTLPTRRFVLPARTRLSSAPSRQGKCLDDTKLGACGAYGKGMRLGVEMQSVACFCAWIFKVQRSWISEASRSATGASDLKFHRVFEYWNLEVLCVVRSNFSAEKYACLPERMDEKPSVRVSHELGMNPLVEPSKRPGRGGGLNYRHGVEKLCTAFPLDCPQKKEYLLTRVFY
jgi:hypothetical protein